MPTNITVKGLDDLIARMQSYPDKLKAGIQAAMSDALLVLWQNVPPYPPEPDNSSYRRTGTLGRTLGSSEGGGKGGGQPDIYEVHPLGSSNGFEARFGTNLDYAPYVVDDDRQAWMHRGRWWVMTTIAERAHDKVVEVFQRLANTMSKFLERK